MPRSSASILGVVAALLTVLITAGWQIMTRHGVTTNLKPIDIALLRYGLPGLILLPLIIRVGPFPKGIGRGAIALIVLGSGLPFGLLAIFAAGYAPVAHMGVLLPGGIIVFVALLTTIVTRQRLPPTLLIGTAFIGCGIAVLAAETISTMSGTTLFGDALFLLAALMWAAYTLALRSSGLTAFQATVVSAFWSLIMIVPVWPLLQDGHLFAASRTDLGLQILVQSLLAGVVAVWSYSVAVQELGAMRTAAIGALIPVFSGVGGHLFLGEPLGGAQMIAAGLVLYGVLIATGAVQVKQTRIFRNASS